MADILVIDDDDLMIELISDILTDEGHAIRSAMDGRLGLEAIAGTMPALVILDMNMPEMDGYAVARRLRAAPATASLPIIAVTAQNSSADYDAAYEAGCDAFISKPLQPDQLIEAAQRLLSKASLQFGDSASAITG